MSELCWWYEQFEGSIVEFQSIAPEESGADPELWGQHPTLCNECYAVLHDKEAIIGALQEMICKSPSESLL